MLGSFAELADSMTCRGRLLAGVSGGADSVALLGALTVLRDRGQVQLAAVHVNHGLRGNASDGDEAFVRSLCDAWQVPLKCFRADPPPSPGEDWARQARYGFFHQAAADTHADALVLAHHRDDQAETLLLHLMRGAGLQGLCGMGADTVSGGLRILRPLLGVSRQTLREVLIREGQAWREDASNGDTHYLRNAVRAELLPLMERLSPGASAHLAETAGLLGQDRDTLTTSAESFLHLHGGRDWLYLEPLAALTPGLQAWVVRRWWAQYAGGRFEERSLSHEQTEALLALASGHAGDKCNLPGGLHGQRGWQCLHLTGLEDVLPEASACTGASATFGDVTLTMAPGGIDPGDGRRVQELPREMLAGCALRGRRAGDWLRPYGSQGRQSLQDYLVNRRIDAPFRDRVPLVCRGSEVLLAGGVGAGAVPDWRQDGDNVRLMFSGDMPWMKM